VTFLFAELYWDAPNSRLFSVSVEGSVLATLSAVDLIELAGQNTAVKKTVFPIVSDGTLNINFFTIVDNAKVSGILVEGPILSSTAAPTTSTTPPTIVPTQAPGLAGDFNIALELAGDVSVDEALFTQAMYRWQSVIREDLVDKSGTGLDISGFFPGCTVPSSIDDVYMCAEYQEWDGRGGTLAVAGPLYTRPTSEGGLPYVGGIIVDSADVGRLRGRNDLYSIIIHEMGHVSEHVIEKKALL